MPIIRTKQGVDRLGKMRFCLGFLLALLCFLGKSDPVCALQTIYESPYVSFSPDGKAWTTNEGDENMKWYPEGMKIETGLESKLVSLQKGEHYYKVEKQGTASVGYWQVIWNAGQCIHGNHTAEYHQLQVTVRPCLRRHFSGWKAFCADCGEVITKGYLYMNEETARGISVIPLGMDYYYICPFCYNLEQGYTVKHDCKEVSANRYRVKYIMNPPEDSKGYGLMDISIHMYDNQTVYEGEKVIPQTQLSRNTYRCDGYSFAGWNTESDGSGRAYSDGEEILNLTDENWNGGWEENSSGTVILYAQWQPAEGTLVLNPGAGKVQDKEEVRIKGLSHTEIQIKRNWIQPPAGFRIRFEANGGDPVPDKIGTCHFAEWRMDHPFAGKLREDVYTFPEIHGNIDTLIARYEADPILLPETKKEGYAFGGWYFDEECTKPAGTELIPTRDTTLYADWVELILQAEANYDVYQGEGAVDLHWNSLTLEDGWYRLYQQRDGEDWIPVKGNPEEPEGLEIKFEQGKTGKEESYEVPETGIYSLTVYGAQGGDYQEFSGGKGGMVTANVWLERGETLFFTVGGKDGYHGGGTGSLFSNGGGSTTVWSDKKGLIAVAGGGGSASYLGNGGEGGSEASVVESGSEGESGGAGGGAGYLGGKSGELIYHTHSTGECGYHKHTGNSSAGGGCYQKLVNHVHSGSCPRRLVQYCGGSDWEGKMGWCPNCGVDESNGCTNSIDPGICVSYYVYSCNSAPSYQLNCGLAEGYHCGKTEKDIESSKPAYGGSSYLCETVALSGTKISGQREGDGKIEIQSVKVGYQKGCEALGVFAPDREAPDPVAPDSVRKLPAGSDTLVIQWDRPKDKGTVYYHLAEAYDKEEEQPFCKSNITETTLCSGVAGYYTRIDNAADTIVTKQDGFQKENEVRIGREDIGKYCHIAVVDRAGNMSETTHIKMEAKEVLWNVYTEKLVIREGENVAAGNTPDSWYVRCDGNSPVYLTHSAVMEGNPELTYQLSEVIFRTALEKTGQTGKISIQVPRSPEPDSENELTANQLEFAAEGDVLLSRYAYTLARRLQRGKQLLTTQAFLPAESLHGKALKVVPAVTAQYSDGKISRVQSSSEAMDEDNGLTLIGDGEGPSVQGLDILRNTKLIHGMTDSLHLLVTACDEVSGLRSFSLVIQNLDNGLEHILEAEDGEIQLELIKQDPLFSGDFRVVCTAVDRVGNTTVESLCVTEFELETRIERVLLPHDAPFQRGESGCLNVRVRGYAEKLEILFPKEWTQIDPSINRVFDYREELLYEQEETLRFMVPLYVPANQEYEITVKAYKKDMTLEDHPSVVTLQVTGSILDELRTRLR